MRVDDAELALGLGGAGASRQMTAAAQPSAKIACKIASFTLSSNVVCTELISTQTIRANFPGCDAA